MATRSGLFSSGPAETGRWSVKGPCAVPVPATPQHPCHVRAQIEGAEVGAGAPRVHSTDRGRPPLWGGRAGSPWVTGQAWPGSLFLGSWLFRSGCGFGLCHRALVFYIGSHCFFFFHLLLGDPPLDCLTRVPSSRDSYVPPTSPPLLLLLLQLIFLFPSSFSGSSSSPSPFPFSLSSYVQGRSQVS